MGKKLGLSLGLSLALVTAVSFPAAAETVKSKVKDVDKGKQIVVLEDGTQVWVTTLYVNELAPGDSVTVSYETKGDQKVATEIDRRAKFSDGQEYSNFGTRAGN